MKNLKLSKDSLVFFGPGVGAICIAAKLAKHFSNIVCFSDFKNAPYGSQSLGSLHENLKAAFDFIKSIGVHRIFSGCNTSSAAYESSNSRLHPDLEFVSLIDTTVTSITSQSQSDKLFLLGSPFLCSQKLYSTKLKQLGWKEEIFELAVPSVAKILDSGNWNPSELLEVILSAIPDEHPKPDQVWLTCSHFELVEELFRKALSSHWQEDIKVYSQSHAVFSHLRREIISSSNTTETHVPSEVRVICNGISENFQQALANMREQTLCDLKIEIVDWS